MAAHLPPISQSPRWWFLWLLATVILPATAGALMPVIPRDTPAEAHLLVVLVIFFLHLISSFKLDEKTSSWVAGLLLLGGWIMIPMSFYLGCAAFVTVHAR